MHFNISELQAYIGNSPMCKETHPNGEYSIYGYYSDATNQNELKWDNLNVNCRGLILDQRGNVIERPFSKFWTFRQYLSDNHILLNDNQILYVPNEKFRILEKIDGSLVCLYWIGNRPFLSTQRSFSNIRALYATKILYQKYENLFSKLDRNNTYVFEAVYPETNVLIDYGETVDLYLIGVIDKTSGIPLRIPHIGFPTCRDFTSEYKNIHNFTQLVSLDIPNQEGFVLYFKGGKMMKIKFPWYQQAHHILDSFLQQDKEMIVSYKRMCECLYIKPRIVDIKDIESALTMGDENLHSIRSTIPRFYYMMGFEPWLNRVKDLISGKEDKFLKEIFKGTGMSIIPSHEFDFYKRILTPNVYETIVWNWKERYLKQR